MPQITFSHILHAGIRLDIARCEYEPYKRCIITRLLHSHPLNVLDLLGDKSRYGKEEDHRG